MPSYTTASTARLIQTSKVNSPWILHNAITSKKHDHDAVQCQDTIKAQTEWWFRKTEVLSLLTSHSFPTVSLVVLGVWSLSIRDCTPFGDTEAHHDARIPHLFTFEGQCNAMQCNSTLPYWRRKVRTALPRARRANLVCIQTHLNLLLERGKGAWEKELNEGGVMRMDDAEKEHAGHPW